MEDYLLVTDNLTKIYKSSTAVDKVNLHIRKGCIYGLIGKNGAGKTTIMKMISGMASPSSGSFSYVGFNGGTDEAFSRIGTLIEAPAIQPNFTAYDNMKMKCLAYGIGDAEYINEKLALVGLGKVGKKKAGKFSLGMKQRLGIALALVGAPDFLLLDEPI
ncbi:MAG: ATP-binding cassette domain-containing protein, partial [Saccharofermentans sp.]|nr:ATP-binding cassette domain-containing protein [Saccharofermentans sp.]